MVLGVRNLYYRLRQDNFVICEMTQDRINHVTCVKWRMMGSGSTGRGECDLTSDRNDRCAAGCYTQPWCASLWWHNLLAKNRMRKSNNHQKVSPARVWCDIWSEPKMCQWTLYTPMARFADITCLQKIRRRKTITTKKYHKPGCDVTSDRNDRCAAWCYTQPWCALLT